MFGGGKRILLSNYSNARDTSPVFDIDIVKEILDKGLETRRTDTQFKVGDAKYGQEIPNMTGAEEFTEEEIKKMYGEKYNKLFTLKDYKIIKIDIPGYPETVLIHSSNIIDRETGAIAARREEDSPSIPTARAEHTTPVAEREAGAVAERQAAAAAATAAAAKKSAEEKAKAEGAAAKKTAERQAATATERGQALKVGDRIYVNNPESGHYKKYGKIIQISRKIVNIKFEGEELNTYIIPIDFIQSADESLSQPLSQRNQGVATEAAGASAAKKAVDAAAAKKDVDAAAAKKAAEEKAKAEAERGQALPQGIPSVLPKTSQSRTESEKIEINFRQYTMKKGDKSVKLDDDEIKKYRDIMDKWSLSGRPNEYIQFNGKNISINIDGKDIIIIIDPDNILKRTIFISSKRVSVKRAGREGTKLTLKTAPR